MINIHTSETYAEREFIFHQKVPSFQEDASVAK